MIWTGASMEPQSNNDMADRPNRYTRDELREVLRQVRPADLHWLKLEGIGQEQRARLGIVPTPKTKQPI